MSDHHQPQTIRTVPFFTPGVKALLALIAVGALLVIRRRR